MYVLLHYKHHNYPDPNNPTKRIDSGDIDSSSKRIGVYTQATYDEYVREDEASGKTNTFNKMHGKYIILHDPTIEDGASDDIASLTKAELIERLNGLPATDEELHTAANPATKKADIISLIEKYENQ